MAYLQAKDAVTATDVAVLADYGVESWEVAVHPIQLAVAEHMAAGLSSLEEMGFNPAVELLGG